MVWLVSANYFRTIGVEMALGPGFDARADDPLTAEPIVVLPYNFWTNLLGSDPDIVGKTLNVDGVRHVVVGVAPEGFSGHTNIFDMSPLFVSIERHPRLLADARRSSAQPQETLLRFNRDLDWIRIHGRLRPGVSIEQAQAAASLTTSRLAERYPASNEFKSAGVEPYTVNGALDNAEALEFARYVLLVLTGMVLLVVCLNISGMTQVRTALRERELSIREAMGATRTRLFQYLLSQSIMLAALAGALAAFVLFNVTPLLIWWFEPPFSPHVLEALRPGPYMIAICIGSCVAMVLAVGLLPAIRFSRPALISELKDDSGVGGRRIGRIHRLTAALQAGIAIPILVISLMNVEQALSAATADLGFDDDSYAAIRLDQSTRRTVDSGSGANDIGPDGPTEWEDAGLVRNVRNDLEQAGGVQSVTVADGLPLDYRGRQVNVLSNEVPARAHVTRVGAGYLETMGIRLLEGRQITAEDVAGAELVTVVTQSLADRLFPNANAIGERLTFELETEEPQAFTVVGVAADFVSDQIDHSREQLLLPLAQHPTQIVYVVARSAASGQSMALTVAFENAVRDLDADFIPAASIFTGERQRRRGIRLFWMGSAATAGIASLLLVLASLGTYGLVGSMVATRTREIAVRVALGTSHRRVLGMVLFNVVKSLMPGLAVGVLMSIAVVRGDLLGLNFPVGGVEFLAYGVGAAITILVALLASSAPARRAASVDPMVAMRSE